MAVMAEQATATVVNMTVNSHPQQSSVPWILVAGPTAKFLDPLGTL